jgi:uncharacterized delta-60 repeat protein
MKKILLPTLVALFAVLPTSASAEPGELDRSFGSGGQVTTPTRFSAPWSETAVHLAAISDGGSFVAADGGLRHYLEDGRLDTGFGAGGFVRISPRGFDFQIGDLAVDPQGRPVVVGRVIRPRRSFAAIVRYLPDGKLDQSFGHEGAILSEFGLRSPQRNIGPSSMAVRGLVDGQGRIVVVIAGLEYRSLCGKAPRIHRQDRLVVRLDPDGSSDLPYGYLGRVSVPRLQRVNSMAFTSDGGVVLAGVPRRSCGSPETALVRLRANGTQRKLFGTEGARKLTGTASSVAVDPRGRIVVLFQSRQQKVRDESTTKIVRLLPRGDYDPDFENGWITYTQEGPVFEWKTVAIRPDGKPILVGTLVRRFPGKDRRIHRWFAAVPLSHRGRLEAGSSWRGWVWFTRFDQRSDAAAGEAVVDEQGRLLIAGTARRPQIAPQEGLALARFELR